LVAVPIAHTLEIGGRPPKGIIMKTITIGDQLLDELFPDFTKQLVRDWTRVHVDDLAAEVFGAIGSLRRHRQAGRPMAASAESRPGAVSGAAHRQGAGSLR
jgi:hypothetical protein